MARRRQQDSPREPSKIFRPAFAKMVANLNSRGITNSAINASVTPSGKRPRAGVTEFINLGNRGEIPSLEKYLLSDVVDEKALECFFTEALEILRTYKIKSLNDEPDISIDNDADLEDFSEKIDFMINQETAMSNSSIGNVKTGEGLRQGSYRIGQQDFSDNVCSNYSNCCCFPDCSIHERTFLRGAHIARWADVEEGRGDLSNGLCLCLMHDKAFEAGFFTLTEDFRVAVNKNNQTARTSKWCEKNLIPYDGDFISLGSLKPSVEALRHHWVRIGFTPDS